MGNRRSEGEFLTACPCRSTARGFTRWSWAMVAQSRRGRDCMPSPASSRRCRRDACATGGGRNGERGHQKVTEAGESGARCPLCSERDASVTQVQRIIGKPARPGMPMPLPGWAGGCRRCRRDACATGTRRRRGRACAWPEPARRATASLPKGRGQGLPKGRGHGDACGTNEEAPRPAQRADGAKPTRVPGVGWLCRAQHANSLPPDTAAPPPRSFPVHESGWSGEFFGFSITSFLYASV